MKRIVYCVATGKRKFGEMAMGLARSLSLLDDQNERVIVTDIEGFDWARYFHQVLPPEGPRSALDKLAACERTDADRVLALDVDMLAFKRLDDIFEFCAGHPFLVQGKEVTKGRFHDLEAEQIMAHYGLPYSVQLNGGLAYYERGTQWDELLACMRRSEAQYDELVFPRFRGNVSEEVCMAHAMFTLGYRAMIPPHLQFQESAAGVVGKLHLDVLRNECSGVVRQDRTVFIRPYVFHAWRYKDFANYWKQLDALQWLEEWEDRHYPTYLPRSQRFRRSIERRIQRWFKGR